MAFGYQDNSTLQKAKKAVKRAPKETLKAKRIVTGPKKGKPLSPFAAYGGVDKGSASGLQKNTIEGSPRYGQSYRTVFTEKGAVHEYKDGTRVLVKGKKDRPRSINV